MTDPNRANRAMSTPDAFHCKHCGAAVAGAFRLRGEPPQLNVPGMEGHLHRQHFEEWRRLTVNAQSTAQLPAMLAEAFESPLVEPENR